MKPAECPLVFTCISVHRLFRAILSIQIPQAVSASPLVPRNDMPFIRDSPHSLSDPVYLPLHLFSREQHDPPAGNNELGSLFATRDSAKQRIEQNHDGHRRWLERKEEEGRKEDR